MKFRTEISIKPFDRLITHDDKGLSLGSCFAANMAAKLESGGFLLVSNPFGVLYNPLSIARGIKLLSGNRTFGEEDLVRCGDLWVSFSFHGSFSGTDPASALGAMNASAAAGAEALRNAAYVIITFGTAWVYELAGAQGGMREGETAANCHKFPASAFRRRMVTAEEITELYAGLLEGPLSGRHVIFTVSPVRHLADGFTGNSASKATLILAASRLAAEYPDADYFPAFEIMNDDLRDYRFYAPDMLHPSQTAVDYIWNIFCSACISQQTLAVAEQAAAIKEAARHRPMNPGTPQHADFRRRMYEKACALKERYPGVELESEIRFFRD